MEKEDKKEEEEEKKKNNKNKEKNKKKAKGENDHGLYQQKKTFPEKLTLHWHFNHSSFCCPHCGHTSSTCLSLDRKL
ncbi:hypothetical protein M8J76_001841 [Diaphorina citri]|nr:hypothetical protein M8J75_008548 [Diaphorina citri]KAI5736292.1 hypothetical protein M8J76_001841 [Diaphorina citri]KAI5744133.1 hypothetical protein M8J77_025952 [Diaphorina citri]